MSALDEAKDIAEVFRALQSAQAYSPEEVKRIAQVALDAFFQAVALETSAPTGDLAPDAYARFESAAYGVVLEWMRSNL